MHFEVKQFHMCRYYTGLKCCLSHSMCNVLQNQDRVICPKLNMHIEQYTLSHKKHLCNILLIASVKC